MNSGGFLMASKQTEHLKLYQWEADDEVLRADFNADNAKIDAAVADLEQKLTSAAAEAQRKLDTVATEAQQKLDAAEARLDVAKADKAALPKIATGSYTGNSSPTGQTISLNFTPDLVAVWPQHGFMCGTYSSPQIHGCAAIRGVRCAQKERPLLEVVDGGFTVYRDGLHIGPNDGGTIYFYLALRV